jgi:hypothetical protein
VVYETTSRPSSDKGGHRAILKGTVAKREPNRRSEMAANTKIDAIDWLRKQLEEAPDPLRSSLGRMVQMLMDADVDEACTAEWGEHTDDRTNDRNGYRHRPWGA